MSGSIAALSLPADDAAGTATAASPIIADAALNADPAALAAIGVAYYELDQATISAAAETAITAALQTGEGSVNVAAPVLLATLSGETDSYAQCASDDGSILYGVLVTGITNALPVIWQGGAITPLAVPLTGANALVNACSADGTLAVGYAGLAAGQAAVTWTDTVLAILPSLAGVATPNDMALGCSADGGIIVGQAVSAAGAYVAVSWTADAAPVVLPMLPGDPSGSIAQSCSETGAVIVGSAYDSASAQWAVAWQDGVIIQLAPIAGQGAASANACSADGSLIVGTVSDASAVNHAVIWQDGVLTDLGFLPAGTGASANACSADGSLIVGSAIDANGLQQAVLWASGMIQVMPSAAGASGTLIGSAQGITSGGGLVLGEGDQADGTDLPMTWSLTRLTGNAGIASLIATGVVAPAPAPVTQFRNNYVQRRVAARMQSRGEPMVLRRISDLPGPKPFPNPPDWSPDLSVVASYVDGTGQVYLSLSGATAIGRLIASDEIILANGQTWAVMTMPNTVATDADGVPQVDGSHHPVFAAPALYQADALAWNDAFPVVAVQGAGDPAAAIGQTVNFSFVADQMVYGVAMSYEQATAQGWVELDTLAIQIAGWRVDPPPKTNDVFLLNGGTEVRSVVQTGRVFRRGVEFMYPVQLR